MDTLLLIDGTYLLFQTFYGMPTKIYNDRNENIEGVLGFIGGLLNTISIVKPTHLAVFFDSEEGSNRREVNPEYKANRPSFEDVADDDNPFARMDKIFAVLDSLKIKYQEIRGLEVDDVIASYALHGFPNVKIVISSADSDYFQLINEHVEVFRYRGKKGIKSTRFTEEKIQEEYGISPRYFADFKSLIGDTADNIKGVAQVGPKTAAKIINQLGGIEDIITRVEEVQPQRIQENIKNSVNLLRNNYEIIKLRKLHLIYPLEDLIYEIKGLPTSNEVARRIELFK